jgi:hypothetical protein
MGKTISSRAGRVWLMCLISVCFVAALASLLFVARGGAISTKNLANAALKFLGFYLPLLTLVATFFFKERQGESSQETPIEGFLFALFILSLWVLTPVLLLSSGLLIQEVLESIDKLIPIGQSLALMAIGYYFAKSGS